MSVMNVVDKVKAACRQDDIAVRFLIGTGKLSGKLIVCRSLKGGQSWSLFEDYEELGNEITRCSGQPWGLAVAVDMALMGHEFLYDEK